MESTYVGTVDIHTNLHSCVCMNTCTCTLTVHCVNVCVCSHSLLVVGTILGEVLFYQVCQEADLIGTAAMEPESKMEHLQTIHCCGGSVRCATWSSDSRCVHVHVYVWV